MVDCDKILPMCAQKPNLTDSFSELGLEDTDEHFEQRLVGTGEDCYVKLRDLEASRHVGDFD